MFRSLYEVKQVFETCTSSCCLLLHHLISIRWLKFISLLCSAFSCLRFGKKGVAWTVCTPGVDSCWCGVVYCLDASHTFPYSALCYLQSLSHLFWSTFVCTCIPLVCVSSSIHPSCMVVFEATLCFGVSLSGIVWPTDSSCFVLIEIQLGSLTFYQTYWIIIRIIIFYY